MHGRKSGRSKFLIGVNNIGLEVGDLFTPYIRIIPDNFANLPKTLTTDNESVAVVTDETINAKGGGNAEITVRATLKGKEFSDTFNLSVGSIEYSLTSSRAATGIVIARKTDNIEVGEEFAAQAYVLSDMTDEHPYPYGYDDDNLVKFSSSDPSVCRVKNGVLLGVAPGVATITASDLGGNVSDSFTVTVSEPTGLEYTEEQVLEVDASAYDWSTAESTTLAIQQILEDASAASIRKVVFPNQIYNVSPAYGSILIPTRMIVDFSNSVIQIEPSAMTATGYVMFDIVDCEYSLLTNAIVYGERDLIEGTGVESCESFRICGNSYRSGADNCTFSKSPGFNAYTKNTGRKVVGVSYSGVTAGGIDDTGAEIDQAYAYRSGYTSVKTIGNARNQVWLGNVQGFGGYMYLSARVYDLHWYDADKNHIGVEHNCIQYYAYTKPEGAAYARIVFWQAAAPTGGDPDYHAVAHLHSYDKPERCYFKNCRFEDNFSTGLVANGGESLLIDNCVFHNNGYRDPHAAIDWEDGRQHTKGHILRNSTFTGNGGDVTVIGADGLVVHNNLFDGIKLDIRDEVQNSRVWLNQFCKDGLKIVPKTDAVASQNLFWDGAAFEVTALDGVSFGVRQAGNIVEK